MIKRDVKITSSNTVKDNIYRKGDNNRIQQNIHIVHTTFNQNNLLNGRIVFLIDQSFTYFFSLFSTD